MTDIQAESLQCAECGITEEEHRGLYETPLGLLTFTFQPDQGPAINGRVHLCRPCAPGVLSSRLLKTTVPPDQEGKIWVSRPS